MSNNPLLLCILDGFGVTENTHGNAVFTAKMPNYQRLWNNYPHTLIHAAGERVGLPDGQMGNSEVGHLNIGAGRVVYQEYTRITKSIRDRDFFQNKVLCYGMKNAKDNGKATHLMGLLSDGGVHSHINHLFALLELAKQIGLTEVYIHCFLDGRDVPPSSALMYLKMLKSKIDELGVGKIATVSGRYYAMDRDKRWDRLQKAYQCMVNGVGIRANCPIDAVSESYDNGVTDEFVEPIVITENNLPVATVNDVDTIIFYNFRADRAREIMWSFVDDKFKGFPRGDNPPKVNYICFTQYDAACDLEIAFSPNELVNLLGEVLAKNDKKQLRIAETEKYAHVTFFFNGQIEEPNPLEDRELIPSPSVATYDLKPEMSAYEVCDRLLNKIDEDKYDVIILNFANPDMVGHTGNFDAAVKALEAVDECLGKVIDKIRQKSATMLVTADHGNSETMMDQDDKPFTAHTTNLVPFIIADFSGQQYSIRDGGALCDIAPTMLFLIGIEKPGEMTGFSLVDKR